MSAIINFFFPIPHVPPIIESFNAFVTLVPEKLVDTKRFDPISLLKIFSCNQSENHRACPMILALIAPNPISNYFHFTLL